MSAPPAEAPRIFWIRRCAAAHCVAPAIAAFRWPSAEPCSQFACEGHLGHAARIAEAMGFLLDWTLLQQLELKLEPDVRSRFSLLEID